MFPLVEHDYIRTRLTHSIEVSSVARGIAAKTAAWLVSNGEINADLGRAVEAIAATCGMIHDLGNPPFGHAGEEAIRRWFQDQIGNSLLGEGTQGTLDFLNWDGNAQTIRLVSKLQVLSDEYGLNLTSGTLSAAFKYLAPSTAIDKTNIKHEWSKLGYFASELELVQKVREQTKTGDSRNPLTFIVEASDDIVYSAVDLEDAIKKRLIVWDQLEGQLDKLAGSNSHYQAATKMAHKKIDGNVAVEMRDDAMVQAYRTYAIIEVADSVFEEFKKRYDSIMSGNYHGELVKDCSAAALIKANKKVARAVVYNSAEILQSELMGRKVIGDLLSIFWSGAKVGSSMAGYSTFEEKAYTLMSSNYKKVFIDSINRVPANADYYRLQLICDYIAGMTDTFACTLHKRLTNG